MTVRVVLHVTVPYIRNICKNMTECTILYKVIFWKDFANSPEFLIFNCITLCFRVNGNRSKIIA